MVSNHPHDIQRMGEWFHTPFAVRYGHDQLRIAVKPGPEPRPVIKSDPVPPLPMKGNRMKKTF